MKVLKILFYIIVSILLFSYAMFLIVPPLVNTEAYKEQIQKLVYDTTKLHIDYSKLKFYSTPLLSTGIIVKDLSVSLDDASTVLEASRIKGGIAIPSLLTLTLKTSLCYVDNPKLNLEIINGTQYKIVQLIEDLINENISKPKDETAQSPVADSIAEKIKIKIPSIKIKNYNITAFDDDTDHSLSLVGDLFDIGYSSPDNIVYVNALGKLKSDNKDNISAKLKISAQLPKTDGEKEEVDPDERILFPFVNLVDIYQTYDLHCDIAGKLKIRDYKEGEQLIHGFLNVDNLNLKLSDIRLPDSFAHLQFHGRRIKYISEIWAGDNEAISLFGQIKHGRKPGFSTSIVTDKIYFAHLLDLSRALLDSLNIKHDLNQIKASGYLEADCRIKTNFKKLTSDGKILIKEGSFINSLYDIGVKDINFLASLDNNALEISDTRATINGSVLSAKGYIDNSSNTSININANNLSIPALYRAFAPKELKNSYDITSANISGDVSIEGKLEKLTANIKAVLSDFALNDSKKTMFLLNKSANLTLKAAKSDISAQFKNKGFSLLLPQMNTKTAIENLQIDLDNNTITINPFDFTYNSSSYANIYGTINNWQGLCDIDIFADSEIMTSDIAKTLGDSAAFVPHKGKIPLKVSIKGNNKKQRIIAQIYADFENYISPIVINSIENYPSIMQAIVDIKGDNIRIKNSGLYLKARRGLSDILEYNMEDAIQIADLKGIINGSHINLLRLSLLKEITGRVSIFPQSSYAASGKITLTGNAQNLKYGGDIKVKNLDIPEILLNIKNIDLNMLTHGFKLKFEDIDINKQIIQASLKGDLRPSNVFKIFDIDVNSNSIDVDKAMVTSDKLMTYMPQSSSTAEPQDIPVEAFGKLDIKKIKTGDIIIEDIKSTLGILNNDFYLQDLACKAFKGKITGDIKMNLLSSLLTVKVKGKNIDLDNMMVTAAAMKDTLSGTGDFSTDISLKGATYLEQVKSLAGNIKFNFKNGTYGPFSKLENFFIAENIRENPIFKNTIGVILTPILTFDSSHYETLSGSLDFKNGIVQLNPITSRGDILCVLITGNMDLVKNVIDSRVRVRLASVISDLLGPLALANPINLVKNTPGLNIATAKLFSIFSVVVSEEEYNQIPDFSSKHSDKNATKFQVLLKGDVNKPLKLVKGFKWLALQKDMDAAKKFSEEFIAQQEELARQAEMKRLQEEWEQSHKTKTIVKKVLHIDNTAPEVKKMQEEKANAGAQQ